MSVELGRAATALEKFAHIVGEHHVLRDEELCRLYSNDLSYSDAEPVVAVIRPGDKKELVDVAKTAGEAGLGIVPRGGGMSYTRGYVPASGRSVMIDMSRMNRIVEINADDMYVVVEPGCTWKTLYEALALHKLRTPYFGPLSGAYATIGGALSQNSLFHGSGVHGTVAESVLGLTVVTAHGSVIETGSRAAGAKPFFRQFGPDTTGLFTSDTGAFGIKAEAVLRLIPVPAYTEFLSYRFDTLSQMIRAQIDIAKLGIASECYGFDPFYNRTMEANGISFTEGLSILTKIASKGGLGGFKRAAKVALGGKSILRDVQYSLHITVDGLTEVVAQEHASLIAEICEREGGQPISNSVPTVFRNAPFGGIRALLLGPDGEVWLPVHGYFPLSDAERVVTETERFLEANRDRMDKAGIRNAYLTCFARTAFFIEPIFFWRDALGDFRLSLLEEDQADQWRNRPADETARATVQQLRSELYQLYISLGGIQMQTGKYYQFTDRIKDPRTLAFIQGIKGLVDPLGIMNHGSLGLTESGS